MTAFATDLTLYCAAEDDGIEVCQPERSAEVMTESAVSELSVNAQNSLEVNDLDVAYSVRDQLVLVLRDISLSVPAGCSLGIVGESGSGKSTLALAIMGLLGASGVVSAGQVYFKGNNLTALSEREMSKIRGRSMSIVLQEPMAVLNPLYRVGDQVAEAITAHNSARRKDVRKRVYELLESVGIPEPERIAREYPHRLSGGMCQRVVIAMALANDPEILILDEPTTALDATIQAQILDLVRDLRKRVKGALILVTHDIGVIAEMCQDVAVMYAGRLMEYGSVNQILKDPLHPYTRGLVAALDAIGQRGKPLLGIPGEVPSPNDHLSGCPFAPRCPQSMSICTEQMPQLSVRGDRRSVACWLGEH